MFVAKIKAFAAVVLSVAVLGVGHQTSARAQDGADRVRATTAFNFGGGTDPTVELKKVAEQLAKELQESHARTKALEEKLKHVLAEIEKSKAKADPKAT